MASLGAKTCSPQGHSHHLGAEPSGQYELLRHAWNPSANSGRSWWPSFYGRPGAGWSLVQGMTRNPMAERIPHRDSPADRQRNGFRNVQACGLLVERTLGHRFALRCGCRMRQLTVVGVSAPWDSVGPWTRSALCVGREDAPRLACTYGPDRRSNSRGCSLMFARDALTLLGLAILRRSLSHKTLNERHLQSPRALRGPRQLELESCPYSNATCFIGCRSSRTLMTSLGAAGLTNSPVRSRGTGPTRFAVRASFQRLSISGHSGHVRC